MKFLRLDGNPRTYFDIWNLDRDELSLFELEDLQYHVSRLLWKHIWIMLGTFLVGSLLIVASVAHALTNNSELMLPLTLAFLAGIAFMIAAIEFLEPVCGWLYVTVKLTNEIIAKKYYPPATSR